MPFTVTAYIPSVKPGAYQAVCTSVEEKVSKKDPTNIFRVWEFMLTDGSQRSVGATSSLATTPKSKGGKWVAALIGHVPAVGETVEVEGKRCTIIVALNDDGYEYVEMVAAPENTAGVNPNAYLPETVTARSAEAQHAAQEGAEHDPGAVDPLPF